MLKPKAYIRIYPLPNPQNIIALQLPVRLPHNLIGKPGRRMSLNMKTHSRIENFQKKAELPGVVTVNALSQIKALLLIHHIPQAANALFCIHQSQPLLLHRLHPQIHRLHHRANPLLRTVIVHTYCLFVKPVDSGSPQIIAPDTVLRQFYQSLLHIMFSSYSVSYISQRI